MQPAPQPDSLRSMAVSSKREGASRDAQEGASFIRIARLNKPQHFLHPSNLHLPVHPSLKINEQQHVAVEKLKRGATPIMTK